MSAIVALGAQWGDEGKGKIVDLLAAEADAVVRFQGGHNAGHTLVVDGKRVALHVVPSGALNQDAHCYIGNGVVLSPGALLTEIEELHNHGIDLMRRLWISHACPLLISSHEQLDKARETHAQQAIGTTGRGIGPAYEDKVARRGLRWGDLLGDDWRQKITELLEYHNFLLAKYYKAKTVAQDDVLKECERARGQLSERVVDVAGSLHALHEDGKRILLEGAQGAMLDIDHGTYPFVTSSNTTSGAAATGTGLAIDAIDKVVGVVKAYVTRVGAGPMPSELGGKLGKHLQTQGAEIGTTTGRARRCGWLDLVALKHAIRVNGITSLCLTKIDVLDGMDEIKLCTDYDDKDGQSQPVYRSVPGWKEAVRGVTEWKSLPKNAVGFIELIEELVAAPIAVVSTGPERNETIWRTNATSPLWQAT